MLKNLAANARDTRDKGFIPGWERSPGGGNGNPLQYSYLGSPMDRGAWWATVHGVVRVGHNLATKPPPSRIYILSICLTRSILLVLLLQRMLVKTRSNKQ